MAEDALRDRAHQAGGYAYSTGGGVDEVVDAVLADIGEPLNSYEIGDMIRAIGERDYWEAVSFVSEYYTVRRKPRGGQ